MNLLEKKGKLPKKSFKKPEKETFFSVIIFLIIAVIIAGLVVLLVSGSNRKTAKEQQQAIEQVNNTTDSMVAELDAISTRLTEMDQAVIENMELIETQSNENTFSLEKTLEELQTNVDTLQSTVERIKETNVITTKETTKELETIQENLNTMQQEITTLLEKEQSVLSSQMIANQEEVINQMESLSGQLDEARGSIEDLLNRISESELKNQEELKKLLTEIRTEFAEALETSKEEIVETDTQHYEDLTNQMEALHGQIEVTQDKIAILQETMQDEHSKDMETIKKAFSEVKQELVVIQTALAESQESIETLINDFASEEQAHHESTLASLQTMKENLLQVNSDNFTSMITNLTEMEEAYMASMEELTEYLGVSFTEVNESISNTEANLQNQFDSKYQIMIDGQNKMNENITNQFSSITNNMSSNNEGVINALRDAMNEVKTELQSVFTSVSNGKKLLASALLTKGVSIPEDASFAEIKNAILSIQQTILIGTETQYVPGTISYDYHHHVDGSGNLTGNVSTRGSSGGCYTNPIYHTHNSNCYETYTYTDYRYEPIGWSWVSPHTHGNSYTGVPDNCRSCSYCGACEIYGGHSDHARKVEYTATGQRLKCTKTPGATIDGYSLGCGLSEGQIIGAHIIYEQGAALSNAAVMCMMFEEEPVEMDFTESIISERVVEETPITGGVIPMEQEETEQPEQESPSMDNPLPEDPEAVPNVPEETVSGDAEVSESEATTEVPSENASESTNEPVEANETAETVSEPLEITEEPEIME